MKKFKKISNILYAFSKIWKWNKKFFLFYIPSRLVSIPVSLLTLWISRQVIDYLEIGKGIGEIAIYVILLFTALCGLDMLSSWLLGHVWSYDSLFAERYEMEMLEKFLTMDYEKTERTDVLGKYQAAVNDVQSGLPAVDYLIIYFSILLQSVVGLLTYISIITYFSPLLFAVIVFSNVAVYLVNRSIVRFNNRHRDEVNDLYKRSNYLSYRIWNFKLFKDIKLYDLGGLISALFVKEEDNKNKWRRRCSLNTFFSKAVDALLILMRDGTAYFVIIRKLLMGEILAGDFAFYFGLITAFSGFLSDIADSVNELSGAADNIGNYKSFLEIQSKAICGSENPDLEKAPEIEFRNVSYRHEGADKDTLRSISFKVKAGEHIALVGENGAGKTTLIKLLCGLYQPTEGEILINNIPVSRYSREEYFRMFSSVFQDIHLLPVKISEFVSAVPTDKADSALVDKSLEMAGLKDKISSLKDGADTPMMKDVVQNATEFSGGEKQKLMIARSIYKGGVTVVLDEPTAALDPIAESELYHRYAELTTDKTSFFISHRFASTRFCDRILLLSGGRITESGSHDELIAKNGRYAELYNVQAQYYKNGDIA